MHANVSWIDDQMHPVPDADAQLEDLTLIRDC